MHHDRFVLLGLARPRSPWFADVSRWATSAVIAAEFVKCVSVEELRVRLASGRAWSAALLDGGLPAVDRDLLAAVRDAGCAAIVVDDRDNDRWSSIGASGVLRTGFDRGALLDLLDGVATSVRRPLGVPTPEVMYAATAGGRGSVVAVCGPGGTGVSTAAAAVAQGMAASGRDVLLADLARQSEQAALHDVRDVVPGVQELVEAHRSAALADDDVRALTFTIVERGYSLLLGLRRSRYWPALRPRAFASAFASLRRAFDVVVCDVTADLEGEDDAGSADVEDRNVAARTALREADVVIVVGRAGIKGIHSLVRVLGDVASFGVPTDRIVPVVMCAPRSQRARAEIVAAVSELARSALATSTPPSPLLLPNRPIEQAVRDGAMLPSPLPSRLASAVDLILGRLGSRVANGPEPVLVAPGSLGALPEVGA